MNTTILPTTAHTPENLGAPWRDTTSYSQSDTVRIPRTWTAEFGQVRITVTRHNDYGPNVWVVFCRDLRLERQLREVSLAEAAKEAVAIVREALAGMLNSLPT